MSAPLTVVPRQMFAYQFTPGARIPNVLIDGDPGYPPAGENLNPLTQGWLAVPGANAAVNSSDWVIVDGMGGFVEMCTDIDFPSKYAVLA